MFTNEGPGDYNDKDVADDDDEDDDVDNGDGGSRKEAAIKMRNSELTSMISTNIYFQFG